VWCHLRHIYVNLNAWVLILHLDASVRALRVRGLVSGFLGSTQALRYLTVFAL
jgi:hypothetical protein